MSEAAVHGLVDRDGRLIEAGGPLDELNTRAGGAIGQPFAVPQVAVLARLAQRLGITVSRHVLAADGPDEVELWVARTPVDAGVKLAISGWRVRAPWSPPADTARRDRDLVLQGADWSWETDATLHLTAIGAEAARFGVEPSALLGKPLDALMTPKPDEHGAMPMFAVLLAHGPFDDQPATIRATGATVMLSARPRLDTAGNFAGYVGAARAGRDADRRPRPIADALTEAFGAAARPRAARVRSGGSSPTPTASMPRPTARSARIMSIMPPTSPAPGGI